jgi:GT2 family glycosyltransferase
VTAAAGSISTGPDARDEVATQAADDPFPPELNLTLVSRRPAQLSHVAEKLVLASEIPAAKVPSAAHGEKRFSVVMVTFNNLVFTKLCLHTLLAGTRGANYDLIIVDNASTDATPAYLREVAAKNPHVRLILNAENRGFSSANNQGLAVASGDVLVLLNNDTIVPPEWLTRLARHLDNPGVGVVCAVTNRIGNEAEIDTSYRTLGELREFSELRARHHDGRSFDIPMAPMFCLAFRRDTFAGIGPLDEQFEKGMFEDDDYSMRIRAAGLRVICAEDTFVHHFGGASFGNLIASGEHGEIFRANQARFEKKWNIRWKPHERRAKPHYDAIVQNIRAAATALLPRNSTVAVISKGDANLLKLEGHRAWHFPTRDDGVYAGHYPADGAAAVEHLRHLMDRGAEFLLIPQTAAWWLEHYPQLARHLESNARSLSVSDNSCLVYDLRRRQVDPQAAGRADVVSQHLCEWFTAVLPPGATVLFLGPAGSPLPQLDGQTARPWQESGYENRMIEDIDFECAQGAGYLFIAEKDFAWLEQFDLPKRHLNSTLRLIAGRKNLGELYALTRSERP